MAALTGPIEALQARLLGDTPIGRTVTWVGVAVAIWVGLGVYPPNHDVAAILDLVERSRAGERLYIDIHEPNPPLVFALFALPVRIAEATGLSDLLVTTTVVAMSFLASLLLAGRIAARALGLAPVERNALLLASAVTVFAWMGDHLGQRDQMWFVWTLPYLAVLALRAKGEAPGRGAALATGVLAALGFALKPYFLGLWVVGELWLAVRRRSVRTVLRTETLVLVVAAATYVGWTVLFTGYVANATLYASYYSAYDNDHATMWEMSRPTLWIALALAVMLLPSDPSWRAVRGLLVLSSCAWQASAWIQHKGWSYHWTPLWMGLVLAAALLALRVPRVRYAPLLIAALSVAGLHDAWEGFRARRTDPYTETVVELQAMIAAYATDGKVLFLTSDAWPAFPTVRMAGAHLVNRAATMLLPGLYANVDETARPFPYRRVVAMLPVERSILSALTDDLRRARPSLVCVDTRAEKQGFGPTTFDWLAYAKLDRRWSAEFSNYREVGGWPWVRMFLREDLPDPLGAAPP